MARAFAAVDAPVRDASLRSLVAGNGMLLDFTDDGGAGNLQASGNGTAAVAVAQAVLDFGAGCKSEV
jgi:hypothetical protein